MKNLETIILLTSASCLLLSLLLLVPAAIIALFKIEEADHFFGVGRFGGERLVLKGLPFSLGRMAEYGTLMLFCRIHFVQSRYAPELEKIRKNNPPDRLVRLLMWLYGIWFILGISGLSIGAIFMLAR
jgi:hypothetical protein